MGISEFFISPGWTSEFNSIQAGFTLPELGNQALTKKSVYSGMSTADNRRRLAGLLGVDYKMIFSPRQVHSDQVIEVTREIAGSGALSIENALQADGVITNQKGILLITTWADCIPVLLFDPVTNWTASIHSGWKSTRLGIVKKTVRLLTQKGVSLSSLRCAVGPGIRGCCYQVSPDFKEFFPHYSAFFREERGSLYFNLQEVVYTQLLEEGIPEEHIDFYNSCTCCSSEPWFFSCRKDKEGFEGQAAFIVTR